MSLDIVLDEMNQCTITTMYRNTPSVNLAIMDHTAATTILVLTLIGKLDHSSSGIRSQ